MGPNSSVDQQAANIGTEAAPLMPGLQGIEKISPIVEYLLQMLTGGGQPQPKPSTTSQQVGPYRGPMPMQSPLRGQMMGKEQY